MTKYAVEFTAAGVVSEAKEAVEVADNDETTKEEE